MGIDPVTHAPRLDLLDMSSILRSVLNPSLNMQGFLGGAQVLMNQGLLNLAATLSLIENQNLASHNYVQNQVAQPLDITQLQSVAMENFSCSNSPSGDENLVLQQNQVDLLGNYNHVLVHSLKNEEQKKGYDSAMPTPESSSNQLNSSSNYLRSGTEEEKNDFCNSDLFEFDIPEGLDIADIFCTVPQC